MKNVRHAFPAPVFVFGDKQPVLPNADDRDVWMVDDGGTWRQWLNKRASKISGAGAGLFAARCFDAGSTITKYLGQTTQNKSTAGRWKKQDGKKGYVYEFQGTCGKPVWVVPTGSGMYGHYMNHDDDPNCEIDAKTGIITAKFDIETNTELTLDYGEDYVKTWLGSRWAVVGQC